MLSLQKWKNGLQWTGTPRTIIWTSFHWFLLAGRQLLHPALFLWRTELWHSPAVTNTSPIRDFKSVKDACLLQCKSKAEPIALGAVMCNKRLSYSFFLSLAVSCSDLRKHCSSEKWWSDFDGWNLTLLAKNCRCSDPLIFDLRVLIPRVQTAAAHAHASFTLQLHLLVLPAPVSTPILFNSLVAFIFTHLQCLCWK